MKKQKQQINDLDVLKEKTKNNCDTQATDCGGLCAF